MKMKTFTLTAFAVLAVSATAALANEVPAPAGFCEIGSAPSAPGLVLDVKWDDGKGYDAVYEGSTAYVWGLNSNGQVTSGSAIEVGGTIYACWTS